MVRAIAGANWGDEEKARMQYFWHRRFCCFAQSSKKLCPLYKKFYRDPWIFHIPLIVPIFKSGNICI